MGRRVADGGVGDRAGTDRRVAGRRVPDRRVVLPAVLGLHLAAAVVHGSTHALVPVGLSPWQEAVVLATTFVGPVAGVALALRGHRLGVPLFAASMAGALAFGVTFHFLVENPDHVGAVSGGPWGLPFGASAVAVAFTDALGAVVGAFYWWPDTLTGS